MQTADPLDRMPLEDMSGPIAYWGPAPAARPAAVLSPAERSLLTRLYGRLTGAETGAASLSAALDALLASRGMGETAAA